MTAASPPAARAAVRHEPDPDHFDGPSVRWRIRLLGGLELDDGTQRLTRLPSRAVAALLARLALAPDRAHAREELIELLWPGVELPTGRNRLRQALSTLKSILEPAGSAATQPVLQADRLQVRVVPGAIVCDAVRFERDLRAGRVDAARAAYRGELLPGFYDEWIDEERQRLAALHDRLAAMAERAPSLPPAAARPVVAPAPVARVLLPSYLTRMFGAEQQGARLRSLVLAQRLVTLIGPGGSGKTRLAVEVAHSLREHAAWPLPASDPFEPFDLIAFVPLVGSTTRAQALDAVISSLQITQGGDDALRALTAALGGRRTLLIVDNFEQLVGQAEDLVAQLLGALPDLRMLVTSRRTLGLDGEHEFVVDTLALPDNDAGLDVSAGNPAVALFVERARAARADFHLGARNVATVAALVRALEGMPLAIELAASRVRSIAPADMLERLRGPGTPRLDLLARAGPRQATDPRHASMQRTIEWSWHQLGVDQARLLSALTVFAEGFTASAAVALVAEEPFDAQLLLDELVTHSLVHARSDGDALRFGLYQPIREFVTARQDAASAQLWRARLRAWALQFAHTLPRTPPLAVLRTEMPNLMAALASAVVDDASHDAIELLQALRRCLEDVELPAEGLAHARAAVGRCADVVMRARGNSLLAPLLFTAGQAEAALRHAQLGLDCALLDAPQRARALHTLARVRWRSRRRAEEVEPLLDEAQALLPASGDAELRASLLALRAFVTNAHHRDHAAGERLHAQALALWEQLGNQHAINSGRYNLAACAQNASRHAECLQRLEAVISSARAQHDWRRLSQSLNVRGNAHSGLRDWARARADYRECISTAWQSMASYDLAFGLWNLPRALAHLRQAEAAIRLVAFAAAFWRSAFGELTAADLRYLTRIRRLAARLIPRQHIDALWREGEQLSQAQAVTLALAA